MNRDEIMKKYTPERENLIALLHDIQDASPKAQLTGEDLAAVAVYCKVSKAEVMGTVTFYTMFSLEGRAKNIIRFCVSPACHMMGGCSAMSYIEEKLGIKTGEATKDGLFSIETASCLGVCAEAPAMMINDKVFGSLTKERIDSILADFSKSDVILDGAWDGMPEQNRVVLDGYGKINPESLDEYKGIGGFKGAEKALKNMKPEDVIAAVKESGLRGRGGAGFPTGLKWSFTAKEGNKYIVVNADEGEPGTFKDRLVMEGVPYRLIEGMIIAGYAVGSNKGYIYIRGEYYLSIARMQNAIDQCMKAGLLGKGIAGSGFDFEIEIKKGAGAYVCGEETSLIESMEGKRGNPRNKPPFPGQAGFMNEPTVVNNVETLANVPAIIVNGAEWYKKTGTEKSPGTKIYTVFGDVNHPCAVEAPMGTSLGTLIDKFAGGMKGGKKFKAALIGGAAGAIVPDMCHEMKMDYDCPCEYGGVLGSGAVLVMNEERDIFNILKSIMRFFEHESCGKCSPCRLGTRELYELAKKIDSGKGNADDWKKMQDLSYNMKLTAFCPLGQSPYMPIRTMSKYFNDEVNKKFNKGA